MFFSKNVRGLVRWISIGILVFLLTIVPSWLGSYKPISDVGLQTSVNAQPSENHIVSHNSDQLISQAGSSEKTEKPKDLNWFKMGLGAIAGLVLFLYGVTRMAEGMEALAGDRAKSLLSKFTTNRFSGMATGAAATAILDSSSVTIIIVIAMVSAGLLTFVQSLGVVLGSNIGTTIGAQLVAFKVNDYAPIALLVGLVLTFAGRNDRQKNIGLIVFGFGLLFWGLDQVENAMEPLEGYEPFLRWMETLGETPLLGAFAGALFTIAVQSSSATVAVIVTLASQGLVALPAGIALMLGAEVGTCADTLVATIGRERPAIRTGVFHLLFNLSTAAIGILFASQLADLAVWASGLFGAGNDVGRQIANAQLIFNLIGAAIVVSFLPLIARWLETLIPKHHSESKGLDRASS